MIEETLLDDPAALARADTAGDLLTLASAGAWVRTAARLAAEAGLDGLRPEGRPRMVLVAGHGGAALAGDLLAALAGAACPVLVLRASGAEPVAPGDPLTRSPAFAQGLGWTLPGWAGSLDLLIAASADGNEQGLTALVEQAYARGCSVATVAPAGSRLAEATVQARGLPLPYAPGAPVQPDDTPSGSSARVGRTRAGGGGPVPAEADLPPEDPSALWALLTPMVLLAARLGLLVLPDAGLDAAADRLDEVAVRCRPDAETFVNPAKSLAAQLDAALPLLWSDGPCTEAAALRFAAMLADRAGRPALTAALPDALTVHRGLIAGQFGAGADPDDFFRDRVDEPDPLRLQILLLRRTPHRGNRTGGPEDGGEGGGSAGTDRGGEDAPDRGQPEEPSASRHSVARAHRLADAHQIHLGELASIRTDGLQAMAELIALTDFAAVYLGLASGPA